MIEIFNFSFSFWMYLRQSRATYIIVQTQIWAITWYPDVISENETTKCPYNASYEDISCKMTLILGPLWVECVNMVNSSLAHLHKNLNPPQITQQVNLESINVLHKSQFCSYIYLLHYSFIIVYIITTLWSGE
jgi:hypothetical protein